jgi:hypothetical protein
MGISPADVKRMSIWEFAAVAERWIEAHDTGERGKGDRLDDATKDEIWDWMKATSASPLTLKEARSKANGHGDRN